MPIYLVFYLIYITIIVCEEGHVIHVDSAAASWELKELKRHSKNA